MGNYNPKHPLDYAGKYIQIRTTPSQKQAIEDEFGRKTGTKIKKILGIEELPLAILLQRMLPDDKTRKIYQQWLDNNKPPHSPEEKKLRKNLRKQPYPPDIKPSKKIKLDNFFKANF